MKDYNIQKYLKEKDTYQLPNHFDKNMMLTINKHVLNKSENKKYFVLMYLFFGVGLFLGFILAISLIDTEITIFGYQIVIYRFILMLPLIITLLFLFEKIYKTTMISVQKKPNLSKELNAPIEFATKK